MRAKALAKLALNKSVLFEQDPANTLVITSHKSRQDFIVVSIKRGPTDEEVTTITVGAESLRSAIDNAQRAHESRS